VRETTRLLDGLLAAIRAESGCADAGWARAPRRIEGGSWADIFEFRLRNAPSLEGRLVARILPDPASLDREMLIQSYVAKAGSLAPAIHLGAPPTAVFDRAWFLMDFAEGETPFGKVTKTAVMKSLVFGPREAGAYLARTMVAIHQMDASPIAMALSFPRVVGPLLDWLYSRASRLGDGALIEGAQRLLATRPAFTRAVLCHGDLHPLNIIRRPGGEVAVDWTHAQYDDPLYDVAFTHLALTVIPAPAPAIARPFVAATGRRMAHRFLAEYERLTSTTVDRERLGWFTRLAALRIRVEAAEWAAANPGGDPRGSAAQQYLPFLPRYGL
jgi:aminoglycoside phosphotransferase (APT) family kinase protein